MITIHVLNIEGKGTLPIHGDGKTESLAAGYDIVAVDDPTVVGEVGNEVTLNDGTKIQLYKSIQYLEYHTALKISPQWEGAIAVGDSGYIHTLLYPRSSIRKFNLVLANSVGVIDNDYRGEILVSYKYCFQPEDLTVTFQEEDGKGYKPIGIMGGINWEKVYRKGDKIGQLVAEKTNECNYVFVNELTATARGEGGHGSTDVPTQQEEGFNSIADLYNKAGGIPIQKKYIDRVKERERLSEKKPVATKPVLPTGIRERKP